MPEEDATLALWHIYVGNSLTSEGADPVVIAVEFDVLGALWSGNKDAWRALLTVVAEDAE